MKHIKKKFLLLVSTLLIIAIACAAVAQGHLLTIWNAGSELMFNTSNVSLTGHAAFTYDDELFKVFDGRYVQDGTSSNMQVVLDTPLDDEKMYSGSYTVFAEDGLVYSVESYYPNFYESTYTYNNDTILTNSVMRSSLMRFGGLLLDLVEGQISSAITHTASDQGSQYQIRLQKGETPAVLNAALLVLMQLVGKEYFYLLPDPYDYGPSDDLAFADNWEALFAIEYEKNFHEPLPENFYDLLWEDTKASAVLQARYDLVCEMIDLLVQQADEAYDHGTTAVMNDGSFKHFENYDEYLIATGNEEILYEDHDRAFRAFYEKKTGTPLSRQDQYALYASTNEALLDEYIRMSLEMREEYLAILRAGGYSCAIVKSDGTLQGFNNVNLLYDMNTYNNMTVKERFFFTLADIAVDTTDLTIALDQEGRLSAVKGSIAFTTVDIFDAEHTLAVELDCTAYDYGASHAVTFDPEKMNLVSLNEYYSEDHDIHEYSTYTEEDDFTLPETLVFNGVEYELLP